MAANAPIAAGFTHSVWATSNSKNVEKDATAKPAAIQHAATRDRLRFETTIKAMQNAIATMKFTVKKKFVPFISYNAGRNVFCIDGIVYLIAEINVKHPSGPSTANWEPCEPPAFAGALR